MDFNDFENFNETYENLIKDISEFGIDITKYTTKMSEDLKYTICYNENFLVIINNEEKNLISKNNFNKKIQNLKVFKNNYISFILDDEDGSSLYITNLDCMEENLQIKRPFKIIEYLIFNFLAPFEFYLYINDKGDIHLCKNSEIIGENNIFKDSQLFLRNFFFNINDIIKIYFSEETQNLLIFLNQGKILYYKLDTTDFNLYPYDYSIGKIISKNKNILQIKNILDIGNQKNLENNNKKNNNIYMEIVYVKTIINEMDYGNKEYYIIVGYNQNNFGNKLEIYLVIEKDFDIIKLNLGNFPQKFLVNFSEKNISQTEELILHELYLFNSTIPLSSEISESFPDTIIFIMKSRNDYNFYIFLANLKDYLKEEEKNERNLYFNSFTNYEKNKIQNLKILGFYFDNFSNQNFPHEKLKFNISNFNLSLRILFTINKNNVYLYDEYLGIQKNYLENDIKDKENIYNNIITSDINEYLENYKFYFSGKNKQNILEENLEIKEFEEINLNDFENHFLNKIIKKNFEENLFVEKKFDISTIPQINKNNYQDKLDIYLLYLIISNEFLSIKYYISISDKKTDDSPYISNEKLFYTVEVLYNFLKSVFLENLKDNLLFLDFFRNPKFLETLNIITKLLYISKNIAEVPVYKPFKAESEIILENSIEICKHINDVENLILIVKIFKNYAEIIHKKSNLTELGNIDYSYLNLFSSLLIPNLEKNIFPEIKLFYLKFIENSYKEKKINFIQGTELNIALENSIYITKCLLFINYLYFIILTEALESFGEIQSKEDNEAEILLPQKNISGIKLICFSEFRFLISLKI